MKKKFILLDSNNLRTKQNKQFIFELALMQKKRIEAALFLFVTRAFQVKKKNKNQLMFVKTEKTKRD
jgi:hypothetical protein